MKTAISLPDEIFSSAEKLARRMGLSRSELYANALRDFVEDHREDQVTEALNIVYETRSSTLDPALQSMQSRSLPKEKW